MTSPAFKITVIDDKNDKATVEFYNGETKLRTETLCTRGFTPDSFQDECWRLAQAYATTPPIPVKPDFTPLVNQKISTALSDEKTLTPTK